VNYLFFFVEESLASPLKAEGERGEGRVIAVYSIGNNGGGGRGVHKYINEERGSRSFPMSGGGVRKRISKRHPRPEGGGHRLSFLKEGG